MTYLYRAIVDLRPEGWQGQSVLDRAPDWLIVLMHFVGPVVIGLGGV